MERLEIYDPSVRGFREVTGVQKGRDWFYEDGSPIEVRGAYVSSIKGYRDNPPRERERRRQRLLEAAKDLGSKATASQIARHAYMSEGTITLYFGSLKELRKAAFEENPPRKVDFDDTELHVWQERDRAHVELRHTGSESTIVEWWDEDVQQAVEDGFLDSRDLHRSAYDYADEHGLLALGPQGSMSFDDGAAAAIWASTYISAVEELAEDGANELYDYLNPGAGGAWEDVLPEVPEAALKQARAFAKELVRVNKAKSMEKLLAKAANADGGDVDEEEFGYYTAMPALGEGVSWFDDHGDFDLKLPNIEPSTAVENAVYKRIENARSELED